MGNPSWRSGTSGSETAVWAAKIALCFLGILSFGAAARAAVPAASGAVASVLPGIWASFRSWCAPPYLFVAVHFIIFVIWKLSDQKHHLHHHREEWAAEEHVVESGNPVKVESFDTSHPAPLLRKPSPEIWRDEISPSPAAAAAVSSPELGDTSTSDASCLTMESDERSTASSEPVVKKRVDSESKSVFTVEEDEDLAAAAVTEAGIENDSMDATWRAIMDKSRPAASPTSAAVSKRDAKQPEAPPSSAGHDELNRRFDDFIKRHHEQIRFLNGRQL